MRHEDEERQDDLAAEPAAAAGSEPEQRRRHYRTEKKLKTVPARLGPDLVERLEREADRRDSTMSNLICKALIDYAIGLDHPDPADV